MSCYEPLAAGGGPALAANVSALLCSSCCAQQDCSISQSAVKQLYYTFRHLREHTCRPPNLHTLGTPSPPLAPTNMLASPCLLNRIRNEGHLLRLPPHDQFRWLHRFYLVLDRIAEQHRVYKLYGGPHGFMISTGVAEPDADHATTLLRFSLHLLQAAQSVSDCACCPRCCTSKAGTCHSCGPPPAAELRQASRTHHSERAAATLAADVRTCCRRAAIGHFSVCVRPDENLFSPPYFRCYPCLMHSPFLLLLLLLLQIRVTGTAPLDMVMVLASGAATSGLLGTTSLTYQVPPFTSALCSLFRKAAQ